MSKRISSLRHELARRSRASRAPIAIGGSARARRMSRRRSVGAAEALSTGSGEHETRRTSASRPPRNAGLASRASRQPEKSVSAGMRVWIAIAANRHERAPTPTIRAGPIGIARTPRATDGDRYHPRPCLSTISELARAFLCGQLYLWLAGTCLSGPRRWTPLREVGAVVSEDAPGPAVGSVHEEDGIRGLSRSAVKRAIAVAKGAPASDRADPRCPWCCWDARERLRCPEDRWQEQRSDDDCEEGTTSRSSTWPNRGNAGEVGWGLVALCTDIGAARPSEAMIKAGKRTPLCPGATCQAQQGR